MKRNRKSIGVKLWLYFILFAAVIMTALWLMQIVFLQSFYEGMKTADVKKAADAIISQYEAEDFEAAVDRLTFRNSILVFVTDLRGGIIYSSDEHDPGGFDRRQPSVGSFRPLPADYAAFLDKLSQSSDGRVSYTATENRFAGKFLVYGARLPDAALYISTPLDPVNATTGILSTQLIYVTAISLLFSLVIAFFIARKFSKPVSDISAQAARLARGDYSGSFAKGFCAELDELSETLDHAAVELSKTERLRRELLANISHDLRTPLTMIKAYTEMIHDISGGDREKREAHLAVIARETEHLTLLVNDILDISVMQSGNKTLELTNLNLSDTVKKTLSGFQPICAREGYTVKTAIEPDQYALADEQALTRVLHNLIGNALRYIGADGELEIAVSDLGGYARFAVTDHGPGIPEAELPLIWDRYYKSKEHGGAARGTGLGLSIAKEILELHRARYGVISAVGRGSAFWFEIRK
ncbi:MAG: HAMP domain-containing histidine kinase [Oscillospiraceae bacterium]|nr:HAMP domain-containing histidine kinase [Oscillospiraceae bacterium]